MAANRMVEADYGGMSWQDLYLVDWEGHHIKPVNWNGREVDSNMQFLRSTEHRPFTSWFVARAAEIRGYAERRTPAP
ncbi:MAG: HNH endonuclease [Myxococcales bacterium]|nr:HNH endonuclease [Myxococcales bacterium]